MIGGKNKGQLTLGSGRLIAAADTPDEFDMGYIHEVVFTPEKEIAWFTDGIPQTEVIGIPIKVGFTLSFNWAQLNARNIATHLGIDWANIEDVNSVYEKVPLGLFSDIPRMSYKFIHTRPDKLTITIFFKEGIIGEPGEMGFKETEFFQAQTIIRALKPDNAIEGEELGWIEIPKDAVS